MKILNVIFLSFVGAQVPVAAGEFRMPTSFAAVIINTSADPTDVPPLHRELTTVFVASGNRWRGEICMSTSNYVVVTVFDGKRAWLQSKDGMRDDLKPSGYLPLIRDFYEYASRPDANVTLVGGISEVKVKYYNFGGEFRFYASGRILSATLTRGAFTEQFDFEHIFVEPAETLFIGEHLEPRVEDYLKKTPNKTPDRTLGTRSETPGSPPQA